MPATTGPLRDRGQEKAASHETRRSSSRCVVEILSRCESSECLLWSLSIVVVVEVVQAAIEGFDPVRQVVGALELVSVGGLESLDSAASMPRALDARGDRLELGDVAGGRERPVADHVAGPAEPPKERPLRDPGGRLPLAHGVHRLGADVERRAAAALYRPLRPGTGACRSRRPPYRGRRRRDPRAAGSGRAGSRRNAPRRPCRRGALLGSRPLRLPRAPRLNLTGQVSYLHGGSPFWVGPNCSLEIPLSHCKPFRLTSV